MQYSAVQWNTHEADTIVSGTLALGASDKLHSTAQHRPLMCSTFTFCTTLALAVQNSLLSVQSLYLLHNTCTFCTTAWFCKVYSVQCTIYSVQCIVLALSGQHLHLLYNSLVLYSVQCTVHNVQCTVYSVQQPGLVA